MKLFTFAALIVFSVQSAWSQCKEFKWPENKSKAEEQHAIYSDAMKQGNFRQAVPGIQWFLKNAPNWNTKLYIDAAEVYHKLASAEKNPAKKQVLVDSLMWIYDQRIATCNDEVNVLNRKAIYAAVYNVQNKDKTAEVLKIFDRVFEISGNNVSDNNLDTYMKVVVANFALVKNLSEDDIFARYDKMQAVADAKLKAASAAGKTADVERLKAIKNGADEQLLKMVTVDCNFVKNKLEPKYRANKEDLALAKKIFGFMLVGKCTDDPLWLETGETIHRLSKPEEKDFGLVKNLGVKHLSNDNDQKATEYFKEALALAKTPAEKSESLIYLGTANAKAGNKPAARENYRQAAAADPSNKEAWEKIGDLYATASDCHKKESQAQDRLIYIAAYEMYAKAGNQQKMANAKEQFPSKEDIFLYNWKVGDVKSTGCWIGESVALRTRD